MLGVITSRKIPVCAQLTTGFKVEGLWKVGFRVDCEVGVSESVSPFVVGVCNQNGWDLGRWDEVRWAIGAMKGRDGRFGAERW